VYVRKGASQGELRSQGFFYKPDGEDSGTLGLPMSVPTRPGYRHLFETSAAILFCTMLVVISQKQASWARTQSVQSMTSAEPPVWTGTATRDLCLLGSASLPCWVTN